MKLISRRADVPGYLKLGGTAMVSTILKGGGAVSASRIMSRFEIPFDLLRIAVLELDLFHERVGAELYLSNASIPMIERWLGRRGRTA